MMKTVNEKERLEALGFEQDKGGFWQKGDDLSRTTILTPQSGAEDGWEIVVDRLDEVDTTAGVEPVEIVRLRFDSMRAVLASLGEKQSKGPSFEKLKKLGFKLEGTGGNCTAFIKTVESANVDNGPQILITSMEADAQAPEREDEEVLVGFYDVTSDQIGSLKFKSLEAFLNAWVVQ
jgi:hypothetical protein